MSEVTVRFRGDTRQLDRALGGVNRGLKRVNQNARASRRSLQSISATGDRVTTALRAAGAALLAFGAGSVLKNIVTTTNRFQDLRTTLASVAGGAQEGAKAFQFVSEFSTQTQFGIEELTQTYIKLASNGITPTTDLLTTFTDAAAVTTDQIGSLGAMTDFYTRSLQSQTVELMDLDRLADRGLPVYDILKEKLGVSRSELSKFSKEAGNTEKVIQALGDGINERFGGATEARINNVSTQFSNLSIAAQVAADKIGQQGFAFALGQTADQITKYITQNEDLIKSIGDGLTKAFLYAKETAFVLAQNIELIGKVALILLGIGVAKWAIGVGAAFGSLAVLIGGTLIKSFGFLGKALKATALLAVRHPLIGGIALVIGGIEYFTGAVSGLAEKLGIIGEDSALDSLVDQAGEFANTIAGPVVSAIEDVSKIQEKVNKQYSDIQSELKQTEIQHKKNNTEVDKQAQKAEMLAQKFDDILKTKEEELRVSGLSTEQQALYNLEKEISKQLGRDLLDTEKERLSIHVKQKIKLSEQQEELKRIEEEAKKAATALQETFDAFRSDSNLQQQAEAGIGAFNRLNPAEQQMQNYEDALKGIEELRKRNKIKEHEYHRTLQRLEQEHGKKMLAIKQDQARAQLELAGVTNSEITNAVVEQMANVEMMQQGGIRAAQGTLSAFGNILGSMAGQNKQAFEAYKKLQIAQALISTYSAATKALAFPPGPPVSFLYVAAAVAAGMAQVAAIKSQTYTGRQLGGPVQEGKSFLVGETGPEIFTPNGSGRINRLEDMGGKEVNINFNIQAVDTQGFDELLVSRRGVIQQVISDAMLESGQRSRF